VELFVVGSIAVFFGGFLQSCLGFGFGMVSVPPMLMMLAATEVIPMQIGLSLFLSVPLAIHERRHWKAKLVAPLFVGALLGLPVGMKILGLFDGPYLKITVGVILVFMALAMLLGWSYPVKRQWLALYPVGFLAGIMQTCFSMAGPPIILFLTNQSMDRDTFRANILIFFALLGTVSSVGFAFQGAFTESVLKMMAVFIASTLLGGLLGARMSKRIPEQGFRTITLVLAGTMGMMLLVRNVLFLVG
jgi:uncharacterized protein